MGLVSCFSCMVIRRAEPPELDAIQMSPRYEKATDFPSGDRSGVRAKRTGSARTGSAEPRATRATRAAIRRIGSDPGRGRAGGRDEVPSYQSSSPGMRRFAEQNDDSPG